MASSVVLQAVGLNTQPNTLSVPDGSLSEAKNVIIRRDNVVEQRRGFKLDGDSYGTSSDRLNQLFEYKEKILRHFNSTLQFEDGVNNDGTRKFSDFNGTYAVTEDGLRPKGIESNGNFYFTSDTGVKVISALTSDDFTEDADFITQAGGVKAIDIESQLNIIDGYQAGFLPEDSAVAYRAVWGIKDANDNLKLGTPSPRTEVYNHLLTLLTKDFAQILGALDDVGRTAGGLVTDTDYVSTLILGTDATNTELKTNIISLATKLDEDIKFANDTGTGVPLTISSAAISSGICTVTFSTNPTAYFTVGQKVFLKNFTPAAGVLNGSQTIVGVSTGPNTISFATTATGAVTVTSAIIESYTYRDVTETGDEPLDEYELPIEATNASSLVIQDCLDRFIAALQIEDSDIIPSGSSSTYLSPLALTTTATVSLEVSIPEEITANHFLQIYRSPISEATGVTVLTDLTPSDEMQLIYEAYPTDAELAAGVMEIEDITPDEFRGANLYTNEATGEGILQANDIPPFAKDINKFKNTIFYANTKTRHRKLLSLLGVSQMIEDYNNGTIPKITISNGTVHNTYSFVTGLAETTEITCLGGGTLSGTYFTLNSADDKREYYVWFDTGASVDPAVANKTGIKVLIGSGDANTVVATKLKNTLARYISDFSVEVTTTKVTVTNIDVGYTTNATAGTSGFTINVTQNGRGENTSTKEVLLSTDDSPARAVDITARSLTRVVNANASESVYIYYLSGSTSVPGQMSVEARSLNEDGFYLLTNDSNTGESFNPNLSPNLTISSIVLGTPATNVITTSAPHGLLDNQQVMISATTTTPVVDGLYTVSIVSSTAFRINATITVGDAVAPVGACSKATDTESSTNEQKPNRIYYSKTSEPEAVPIVNYFDVGATDKEILRIFPLQDSLFVFKEDGLYRVSGEFAPFSQERFDSSFILIAPDSLALSNNQIYGWTTQGISQVGESGATPSVSRPIDVSLLKLGSSQYPNFRTSTFGIGYESDNAYMVWTVSDPRDTVATVCYRFTTTTNTWTTYDKTNTCGVVMSADDKLYLGAGDTNYMEQERKEFGRYDYCDREIEKTLTGSSLDSTRIKLSSVTDLDVGDVVVQEQILSVYEYNMLLRKLDLDQGVDDNDYYTTLRAAAGVDMRSKIVTLAQKLDDDTGIVTNDFETAISNQSLTISAISVDTQTEITTTAPHGLFSGRYVRIAASNCTPNINGDYRVTVTGSNTFTIDAEVTVAGTTGTVNTQLSSFEDIGGCYNILIGKLNSDTGALYANYKTIDLDDTVTQEAIITAINTSTRTITLNLTLDFLQGSLTVFKAIECSMTYSPQTMQDPLGYKHLREATVMFENKAFTNATVSFATDLFPQFVEVNFNGDGNGIFGHSTFGQGLFGGGSNSAPFRTYIPRNCQRCRHISVRFQHRIARESWSLFGVTLTGEIGKSTRAYR